ncbi:alpha/beta hydrolase family protein [Streptomonospora algeriensis]
MGTTHACSPTRCRAVSYSVAAGVLAACCAVPGAVAAIAEPGPIRLEPPEPTGPHPVGRADLHLVDASRGHPWVEGAKRRDIVVSVWYPAEDAGGEPAPYMSEAVGDAMAGEMEQVGLARDAVDFAGSATNAALGADVAEDAGKLPVLLYSHGFNQSRYQATAQLEELASRGFAVVAMDHPYEAEAVELPGGRVLRETAPDLTADTYRTAVATRVADTSFVLDTVERIAGGGDPAEGGQPLPQGFGEALDPSSIGMFGHSAGGLTTAEAMLVEDRIDAGADLDGSIAYHVGDKKWADATLQGTDRPFMVMNGGLSNGAPDTSVNSPDLRRFRKNSTWPVIELFLQGAEHMSFVDTQWTAAQIEAGPAPSGPAWQKGVAASVGTGDSQDSVAAQRAYISAFFEEYVRGCGGGRCGQVSRTRISV